MHTTPLHLIFVVLAVLSFGLATANFGNWQRLVSLGLAALALAMLV